MKKYIPSFLLGMFVCLYNYGQTTHVTKDSVLLKAQDFPNNLVINENVLLTNKTSITIRDTLFVHGTLVNNGNIQAGYCYVNNGTIFSEKSNNFLVNNDLHFSNATISSADTINIISFAANDVFIDDYTEIKSAYLSTQNLILNDTLELSGKQGVKTVINEFRINSNGYLLNTDNENIKLYGNAYNYSSHTCQKANFELYGLANNLYGDFSCYRFDLEDDATYTNHGKLTVTDVFPNKGTIIQSENSYLCINTQTSPYIDATATGNTLEYTRGGKQYLNTNECYNLILSKRGNSVLYLTNDTKVHHAITLNKKSFLDCNSYELSFPLANKSSIVLENETREKGIILNDGSINLQNMTTNTPLYIPLFTNDENFAGIMITNNMAENANITIDSIFHCITKRGPSNADSIDFEYVNLTWHLSSNCTNGNITLFWNTLDELPYFDAIANTIYNSQQNEWIDIENTLENEYPTTQANLNGYFCVGNKAILLPISISNFSCSTEEFSNHISWHNTTFANEISLEKSYDGMHFFTLQTFSNVCDNDEEFYDFDISHPTIYYQLTSTSKQNTISHSNILVTNRTVNTFRINNKQLLYTGNEPLQYLQLINNHGEIISQTKNNSIDISKISSGVYFVKCKTDTNLFFIKICL